MASSACGFDGDVVQNKCCVRFGVLTDLHQDYYIIMGDSTIFYDEDSSDDTFEHSYDEPGDYFILLQYHNLDGTDACGVGPNVTNTSEDIQESKECLSYRCWDDLVF